VVVVVVAAAAAVVVVVVLVVGEGGGLLKDVLRVQIMHEYNLSVINSKFLTVDIFIIID
jgi:hypothetical protein